MLNFKRWLQNINESSNYEKPNSLPKKIKVYHGGSDFDNFDLNHLGHGEERTTRMKADLGAGIYFSDCEHIAKLYMKHAIGKPALHTAEIDTTNIFDRRHGTPHLNDIRSNLTKDIKEKYNNVAVDNLIKTFGIEKALPKLMTNKQAAETLNKYGIDGTFTRLPGGCLEIAVYNPNIITKISKEYLTDIPK